MDRYSHFFNRTDLELIAELQQQLPDKVFDVDCHIYRKEDLGLQPEIYDLAPSLSDVVTWREIMSTFVGKDRLAGGLYLTPPVEKDENSCIPPMRSFWTNLRRIPNVPVLS